MNDSVTNELNNLFNADSVSGTERTKILAICNTLVNDVNVMSEIKNSVTGLIEKDGFNIEKKVGAVVSCIISAFHQVECYKEVNTDRMKYIIYCLLISILLKFYPSILTRTEIALLRNLYDDVFDLVMIVPQTVKIAKQGCMTCVGKFRAFSCLNKGKILIN